MSAPFLQYCAERFNDPSEVVAAFLEDAARSAAKVEALLNCQLILDGQHHYLPNLEGKPDKRQFYKGSIETDPDGTVWPAVTFKTFRHGGTTVFWKPRDAAWQDFMADDGAARSVANDNQATEAYRAAADRQAEASAVERADRERAEVEVRQAAAEAAQDVWSKAEPCDGTHPYLVRKKVRAHGLRVATQSLTTRVWLSERGWVTAPVCKAGDLLIPVNDQDGCLVSLQRIGSQPDAKKLFLPGGRTKGCHFRIEGQTGRTVLVEGYATGATWHETTGDTVVVTFSANNLALVAQYACADLVGADHDASGIGELEAVRTGLPLVMPKALGDWNDAGEQALRRALADLACPAFTNPWKLPAVDLPNKRSAWLPKLASAETPAEAAAFAFAIGRRFAPRVPVSLVLADLEKLLYDNLPEGMMNPATLAAIVKALAWLVDCRKQRALSGITMSEAALTRHDLETVTALPSLTPDDYQGVIIVNTPMGSGKTRHIGAPYANWAKLQGSGARLVAVCHRRSLVDELSRVLGIKHYDDVDADSAWIFDSLATCLPSIVKTGHSDLVDKAAYLFIDEIDQMLAAIGSSMIVASKKDWPAVFLKLQALIAGAKCVIVADAGMTDRTVAFLEACRPGERFRIFQQPHADMGLEVTFGYGREALVTAYGEAMARLSEGQKLWIGCGELRRAEELARVLATSGKRILLLHGKNHGSEAAKAFWGDPEAISREYDAVIHTGVISSGLSIEHRDGLPHFDHGMLFASGATITPADAIQMLRRVRYLKTWTVVATQNNRQGITDADAITAGMQASAIAEEMTTPACTTYDQFVAGNEADRARYSADFASGLWWALEQQHFTVRRMPLLSDVDLEIEIKAARADLEQEHRLAIVNAPDLTEPEAKALRDKSDRTEDEENALLRQRIKFDLGVDDVDDTVLDVWDEGRGPRQMDRFSAATGMLADRYDYGGDHLAPRQFTKARALAYAELLGGIDIAPGTRIDESHALVLLEQVVQCRYLLGYLRIVPAKWARYIKLGKPFPLPKIPMREVTQIFDLMGLDLKRREGPATLRSGSNCKREIGRSEGSGRRNYYYEITENSFTYMATWAERRNANRTLEIVEPRVGGLLLQDNRPAHAEDR